MREFKKVTLIIALTAGFAANSFAQQIDCSIFLTHPIFTTNTVQSSTAEKDSFRLLQCSANWHSAQDAQKAGVSATIPIYDIPVPFTANWDSSKVDQWKTNNCTQQESSGEYSTQLYKSTYSVDPQSAKFALMCVQASLAASDNKALRCSLTETKSALLFQAEWRRTVGEPSTSSPIVKSFNVINTQCQSSDISPSKRIDEGGVSVLCTIESEAAAFSLNTDRGQCMAAATPRLPKILIPASFIMTEALFISGDDIEIQAGTSIITHGFPLTIRTKRLSLLGSAQIRSFENNIPAPQAAGRYAGIITIVADDVVGKGLAILNAGEPGGPGGAGGKGPPGAPGGPGQTRIPQWQQKACGPLAGICGALVPAGCTGGQNGGTGLPGGTGYPGNPGAPGGGAGEVRIEVPADARDGFSILTDVALSGQPQQCNKLVCGGIGGIGGSGGPGGDGGPGGPGAPSAGLCGGTGDGNHGTSGPGGPQGPHGPQGASAVATLL